MATPRRWVRDSVDGDGRWAYSQWLKSISFVTGFNGVGENRMDDDTGKATTGKQETWAGARLVLLGHLGNLRDAFNTRRSRWVACGCGAVVLAMVAWFVWPTPYRYDHMNHKGSVYPVRIHRILGRTEYLLPTGWTIAKSRQKQQSELPAAAIAQLDAEFSLTGYGYMEAVIYNGSEWTIHGVTVELLSPAKSKRMEYKFFRSEGLGRPRTNSEFSGKIGGRVTGDIFDWVAAMDRCAPRIVAATGTKSRE